jgi:hypothetical protein
MFSTITIIQYLKNTYKDVVHFMILHSNAMWTDNTQINNIEGCTQPNVDSIIDLLDLLYMSYYVNHKVVIGEDSAEP